MNNTTNMNTRFGAHEFLELQEVLRKLTGDIELHGLCSEMAGDSQLRSILNRHIQAMEQGYQAVINMMHQRGMNTNQASYGMHVHNRPFIGLQNPALMPPNPHAQRLSDVSIATIILNTHKAGSMIGMLWASECANPELRQLQMTLANNCQAMAYEVWQYMNAKGYYQVPQLADHTMQTMINGIGMTNENMTAMAMR